MGWIIGRSSAWLAAAAAIGLAAASCGGDGGNTGGSGGTGGGTTGTGGTTTSSTSTSSSSTGTGGSAPTCIDASQFASLFSIADTSFCAVALYEAGESIGFQAPSWGSHGGPVWFQADTSGGGITIERWKAPAGATGMLTKQTTHVDTKIPDGAFAGAQAVDLPFFGWTAISWTGAFPDTQGQVEMIQGSAVDRTFAVNGAYALAAVGDATSGRLLYTGLSPIGAATENTNGFYAADACDMPKPDLGAGTGCQASDAVAAWGDSSGPLAVDHDGNAFVVLASFGMGNQEARGFAAADVARGKAPTDGVSLFTLPGFGSSLAALAPRDAHPGLLVFQPFDMNATPLDVVAQPYTTTSGIKAEGTPAKLLTLAATPTSLSLMIDDQERLWVVASGDTKTTFVVIARKP
jgi:hypothetical protein